MSNLDPTIVVALVGLAGTLIGVLITRSTETRKIIAGAPTAFAQLVDELQEERAVREAKLAAAERRVDALVEEIGSMHARMRGLEAEQSSERSRTAILVGHIGELRSALRRAGITPPPPPTGSGIEDSGEHVAVVVTGTPA